MINGDQQLSPRQFAEAIGVSESSVRRWADRGKIRITKTAGGHRKITRTEAIRFVRETAAEVIRPELLHASDAPRRRKNPAIRFEQLKIALEQGESEVVCGLLTSMYLDGASAAEICDGPLRGAMQDIGEGWQEQSWSIFVEHRATSICVEALGHLHSHFRPVGDHLALGGAPEGDPYALPSLMVSTVLADVGYRTVNLGANTPLQVISQSACELQATLAWISCTSSLPKQRLDARLSETARQLGENDIHLVGGGQTLKRYALPDGNHFHSFPSLAEMSGFAKSLLR